MEVASGAEPVEEPAGRAAAGGPGGASTWQPKSIYRPQPAYHDVAAQLRAAILSGELRTGDRLPGESELARRFGVSRGTIREAFRVLSSQELIVTTRGVSGGTTVSSPSPDHIQNVLGTALRLLAAADVLTIDAIVEARMIFEIPAVGLAALRRSDDDLAAMRERIEHTDTDTDSDNVAQRQGFHSALVRGTGNSILDLMSRPLFAALNARVDRTKSPASLDRNVHDDHVAILEAVEARDAERAQTLMRAHLVLLHEAYLRMDPRPEISSDDRKGGFTVNPPPSTDRSDPVV